MAGQTLLHSVLKNVLALSWLCYSSIPYGFMKSFCAILIAVLIVHLQCSGSCFSEAFASHSTSAASDPPCPGHANNPSDSSPQKPDETNSPCSQGQVIESKAGVSGKHLVQLTAVLPAIISIPFLNQPFAHELTLENA